MASRGQREQGIPERDMTYKGTLPLICKYDQHARARAAETWLWHKQSYYFCLLLYRPYFVLWRGHPTTWFQAYNILGDTLVARNMVDIVPLRICQLATSLTQAQPEGLTAQQCWGVPWAILLVKNSLSLFFLLPRRTVCGILVPQQGIEPMPAEVEAQVLNH